jgi:hypothetical protein
VPLLWSSLVTALVVAPWLAPGYIFGTDFAGPRHYGFPDSSSSYAGLQFALALAALVLPTDLVGKLLIFAILVGAGFTAYRAVPIGGFLPRAVGSIAYLVNPFVYDRLAYGQLNVLAGYAAMPWVAQSMARLLAEPSAKRALVTAIAFALIAILDIHAALIATVLAVILLVAYLLMSKRSLPYLAQLSKCLALVGIVALAVSSYWLIPTLAGVGPEARTLARIGPGDLAAFSTASDPRLGLLPNVLGLYGFWAERTGRFVSMKEFVVLWPFALAILLALVAIGAGGALRRSGCAHHGSARSWVAGLLAAWVIAVVLEVGVADSHVAPLVRTLDSILPIYRGMRDASKWGEVLALVYSQLAAIGVVVLLTWTKKFGHAHGGRQWGGAFVGAVVLTLPLYYGSGLLFGMHGQIQPSDYPAGWYAADRTLAADPHPGRAVFLPWHAYLALSFIRNSNQVVATPAPQFFSIRVVASQDPEIPGIRPYLDDPAQETVTRLVGAGGATEWAASLTAVNIKYVLLAREVDWATYGYLDKQAGLSEVSDYGAIVLYRNQLWNNQSNS